MDSSSGCFGCSLLPCAFLLARLHFTQGKWRCHFTQREKCATKETRRRHVHIGYLACLPFLSLLSSRSIFRTYTLPTHLSIYAHDKTKQRWWSGVFCIITGTKRPSNGDAQRYKKGCTFYYMTHERSTGASEFAGREPEQERKVYAWRGNIGSEKTGLRSDMVNYKMQKDACHNPVKCKQKSGFESILFMIKKRWMVQQYATVKFRYRRSRLAVMCEHDHKKGGLWSHSLAGLIILLLHETRILRISMISRG